MSGSFAGPSVRRIRLLDADPELGAGLSPAEFEVAQRYLVADLAELRRGTHQPWGIGSPDLLGLFVVDGVIIRTVQVAERRCGELVGAGEIVRPWDHFGNYAPLPFEVSWRVIRPVRLALLEQHLVTLAARWPAVMHAIIVRAVGRSHALALNVAINSLQHVDLRLLVLFWHLADRFGRVTPDGTIVPIKLSHGDIAELIGARRPSVSARLGELAERGRLRRRDDRTWLLLGEPPTELRDLRTRALSLHTDSGPAAGNVGSEASGSPASAS